ncbi:MAG: glycosyltransferase family 4 protein [Lachnospiraceae bacterium]|jgi:glycosyltransferase involved in cell wall biosynthesis|nr:glycosyltransferase family 4 protein [Lachnospiraceae bacterium]
MKIYIDVSVLTLATFVTGIQRVTREIAVRLIQTEKENIVLLHYNAKENVYYRIDNRKFCEFYVNKKGIKNHMITTCKIPLSEIGEDSIFFDLDAAWMCRMKRSYLLPILKMQGARIVAHIYDIISVTHPQYCLERGVYNFMDFIGAHLQYADDIIVNAKATVDELKKLAIALKVELPLCHVVPLGANFNENGVVQDNQVTEELRRIVSDRPYILMVGTIEPRKNHKLVFNAYKAGLKDLGYNIVFAGYIGWNMEDFETELKAHPDYNKRIFHFAGLGDQAVTYLYQHARFLAFCSYTEGFGLPLIEGLMRGTPVVAADIPVSREVAGDYCIWFPQDDEQKLCDIVRYYHENEDEYSERKKMIKGFEYVTWERCEMMMRRVLMG